MIFFLVSAIVYLALLTMIKPAPSSLKESPISYSENLKRVRASACSGVAVLLVFLLTTNFSFQAVDEQLYRILALNNRSQFLMWPFQSLSHLFIHGSLAHLASNVVGLGLASIYERRVGARRFLAVLLVGCLASIPSVFVYSEAVAVSGISGGVFGLAAAYFTDEESLTAKEWVAAILLFLVFSIALSIDTDLTMRSDEATAMRVDHIGHSLGAFGAIMYCRFRPLKSAAEDARRSQAPASPPT